MGAWSYGPLDNDPAKDVLYRWSERVEKNGLQPETVVDLFFDQWGDSIRYGDVITNLEIIALLTILKDSNLDIPSKLKKVAIDAVNRELTADALEPWDEPEKRRACLVDILHSVGGKIRPPKPPLFFSDPALCFKNTDSATKFLTDLTVTSRKGVGKDSPPFLQTLNRLMNYQIWEKDYKIYEQAQRERLMMLAWYVGERLKMDPVEIRALIERGSQWPHQDNKIKN
jgi:hypothetical protein